MPDHSQFRSLPNPGEGIEDYRTRLQRLKAEAAEWRQKQIDEQSSPLNSPCVRIKAWERLHQVDLPRDPAHRLVDIIATNTGLSADEVRAEQTLRAAATE
jgi:hypothetical protein